MQKPRVQTSLTGIVLLACAWLQALPAGAALPEPTRQISPQLAPMSKWRRMAVNPGPPVTMRLEPPAMGRKNCIDMRTARSARAYGDRAFDLTMRGGSRFRLFLAGDCPALIFYQGFYYQQQRDGRLCAGRDQIGARSGGECAIASILPVRQQR